MVLGNKKREIEGLKEKIVLLESENTRLKNVLAMAGIENSRYHTLSTLSRIVEMNGIGFWTRETGTDIFWLSGLARDVLGVASGKTHGWDQFRNSILPEDRAVFEKTLQEVRPGSKPAELELKIARPDGDGREFRVINMVISSIEKGPDADQPAMIVASLKDISRQDKLKRDLIRAKEKSEDAEKLKNTLLSNISHEIRTPMNAIIGFSELLNIGNLPYEKRHDYVKTIKNQGIHLLKMIDDVVELTRIQTGKLTIRKSPCNIDVLLNELVGIFNKYKETLSKDHLELKIKYPEPRGIMIYTDPGRLQQLIANLITNAIKFTEKGWIEVGYKPVAEDRIEFYVKDTGIGLTKDLLKNIFNRFTEEDAQINKLEGTGLGLTISRNLIRLLGGKIWVESVLGEGSTFYFTVPHEEIPVAGSAEEEEEYEISSYRWKDKMILIVEDDEINFKFLEAVLQETGVQILHAKNGVQAIQLCKTISKIDIILMDIRMPEMDGLEATRQIRQFNRKTPIIAQTAYVMESEQDQSREAGCNDHITKPIDIKEFMEKIDHFLREH